MTTSGGILETSAGQIQPANILTGFITFAGTTAATTVVTVPAGKTWVGTVTIGCSVAVVAGSAVAGAATGQVTTAGAGVTPAAGVVARCDALAGANAAGGTVGTDGANQTAVPLVVVAPVGNPVQIQAAATIAGTAGVVNVTCSGAIE